MSQLALWKQVRCNEPHYRKLWLYISTGRYNPVITRGLSKPAVVFLWAFAAVNSQVHRPAGLLFVVLIVCMCNTILQPCPALSPPERLGHKQLCVCACCCLPAAALLSFCCPSVEELWPPFSASCFHFSETEPEILILLLWENPRIDT